MTHQNFLADEIADGATAARRDEPFSQWTSRPWQVGWTMAERQKLLRVLPEAIYRDADEIVLAIGILCQRLNATRPEAVDLAQAIALRALDGQDFRNDPLVAVRTAELQVAL